MKFKVGDRVRCKLRKDIELGPKGAGWREGYEFVITEITTDIGAPIFWKAYRDCGVYENEIELAEIKWRKRIEERS